MDVSARPLRELALFAGAGGGLLGSILCGWRTVCAVEINDYCRRVLLQRQRDGMLERFPIWDDVRTFDGRPWLGCVDIVTAGFPCQPFSNAGKRKASGDSRNMWPHTIRVINEVKPSIVLLENVPGLLSARHGYFGKVLRDLAKGGFDARWRIVSAADVGAPHIRKRLWILSYSERFRLDIEHRRQQWQSRQGALQLGGHGPLQHVADTNGDDKHGRLGNVQVGRRRCAEKAQNDGIDRRIKWSAEPDVGRVAHGVAARLDRLNATGNGQVPAVVRAAWQLLGPSH